jgi:hypothetical protein
VERAFFFWLSSRMDGMAHYPPRRGRKRNNSYVLSGRALDRVRSDHLRAIIKRTYAYGYPEEYTSFPSDDPYGGAYAHLRRVIPFALYVMGGARP